MIFFLSFSGTCDQPGKPAPPPKPDHLMKKSSSEEAATNGGTSDIFIPPPPPCPAVNNKTTPTTDTGFVLDFSKADQAKRALMADLNQGVEITKSALFDV